VSVLLESCQWWRYPVRPPNKRRLDHTRLRGKNRARYPVRVFSVRECRAYVPAELRGCRDGLLKLPTYETSHVPKRPKPQRVEASKLKLKGTWTFHGADRHYTERWTFAPAKQRNARMVRPSFSLKLNRVRNLPAWPESLIRFIWKPNQYQTKSVRRTRAPKIETTDLRRFLRFPPYKPISFT
jgi:hypothetical protein